MLMTLPAVLGSWPSLSDIEKKLDLNDSELNSLPPSALMIPSYANFTPSGSVATFDIVAHGC
jgi:hypothetical protein